MSEDSRKIVSREERLAAKLRENLRRRKAQGKAMSRDMADSDSPPKTETLPNPRAES